MKAYRLSPQRFFQIELASIEPNIVAHDRAQEIFHLGAHNCRVERLVMPMRGSNATYPWGFPSVQTVHFDDFIAYVCFATKFLERARGLAQPGDFRLIEEAGKHEIILLPDKC